MIEIKHSGLAELWESFRIHYLEKHGLTVERIYNTAYDHGDAYVVAEALVGV